MRLTVKEAAHNNFEKLHMATKIHDLSKCPFEMNKTLVRKLAGNRKLLVDVKILVVLRTIHPITYILKSIIKGTL